MTFSEFASTSIDTSSETFLERIEILLQQRGCTKAWLARELGITRQALNQVLNHNKRPKFISEIAHVLNVTPKWLQTGEGRIQTIGTPTLREKTIYANVYDFAELQKTLSINKSKPIDKITVQPHEKYNFAIQLKAYPSMSQKFPENSILIFESKTVAQNEDYVLAQKNKTILFRQYFFEDDMAVLRPLNADFKNITIKKSQCLILGVLRETRIRF